MARASKETVRKVRSRRTKAAPLRVNTRETTIKRLPRLEDLEVPTRWVNRVIAVLLLPACWITMATFFSLLTESAIGRGHWQLESFWFFGLGLAVSILAFIGFNRNFLFLYVTVHEFTHALWVMALGGKVRSITVGQNGGEIHVSKSNFLIALAPYFFPMLTLGLLVVRLLLGTLVDMRPAEGWFWALLGASWGFHLTYTLWMIPKEQSDLTEHGIFFSLVIIFLINLCVLTLMLCLADPKLGLAEAGREWVRQGVALTGWLEDLVGQF